MKTKTTKSVKIPKSEIRAMGQFLARCKPFELVWCDLVASQNPKRAIWWGWVSPDLIKHINDKLEQIGFRLLETGQCKVVMK